MSSRSRTIFTDPRMVPERKDNFIFTLVLDFDETLVTQEEGATRSSRLLFRPHIFFFFRHLLTHFPQIEIIGWSAGTREHVANVASTLEKHVETPIFHHIVCRGESWFAHPRIACVRIAKILSSHSIAYKNLSDLGPSRDGSTLLCDDSIYHALNSNPCLILPGFNGTTDSALIVLLEILHYLYPILMIHEQHTSGVEHHVSSDEHHHISDSKQKREERESPGKNISNSVYLSILTDCIWYSEMSIDKKKLVTDGNSSSFSLLSNYPIFFIILCMHPIIRSNVIVPSTIGKINLITMCTDVNSVLERDALFVHCYGTSALRYHMHEETK